MKATIEEVFSTCPFCAVLHSCKNMLYKLNTKEVYQIVYRLGAQMPQVPHQQQGTECCCMLFYQSVIVVGLSFLCSQSLISMPFMNLISCTCRTPLLMPPSNYPGQH